MRRIVDVDRVEDAKRIQTVLLEKYGIEASIREIQKRYYRWCGFCGCWNSLDLPEYESSDKTNLEAFCEYIDSIVDEED